MKPRGPIPFLVVLSGFLTGLSLLGCHSAGSQGDEQAGPLRRILCTTGMVAELVRTIAGPEVEVQVLMGPGVDPHLFSPSPRDVEAMASADAIVYSGLHLEAGLAGYLEKLRQKGVRAYAVAEGLEGDNRLIKVSEQQFDPHFWNDLELWQIAARNFAAQISQWNPAQADMYQQRAEAYSQSVQQLLDESRQKIASIPADQRILITAHDAFEYLGRSLDLQVAAVQGISTNTEASVRKVEELVDRIVTQKIPAIFAESSVSDKAIRAIIEGCSQRGQTVLLGGTLYSDALGPPGSGAETFQTMYAKNIATIVEGLRSR